MALALQSANLVRQKTRMYTLNPFVFYSLKAFFLWWATNKGNADLQILDIDATTATTGDGQDHGIDEACQLYFVYVKKLATATDAYYKLYDDADNDSEEAGDIRVDVALLEASDIFVGTYPDGLPLAAGVASSFTTAGGDGATQSGAADAGNGFLIIGAA